MAERLIITNGDSATARLREAGIEAELLPWRDILHDGPVPGGLALAALSRIRGRYLATEFDLPSAQVSSNFRERDAAIRSHARHRRIELWFEHDLVDQLQLNCSIFSATKSAPTVFRWCRPMTISACSRPKHCGRWKAPAAT